MTPDMCMKFLIWSYYYYDILPTSQYSYTTCNLFTKDVQLKLDNLKATMFLCVTEDSVKNAAEQLRMAKMRNEVCPYTKSELDNIFLA